MVVRKNVLEYIIALVVVKNKVRLKKCLKKFQIILSNFRGGARRVRPLDLPLGHQFRNLLTLIVENWSKFWY
jgi:hypothetical protein